MANWYCSREAVKRAFGFHGTDVDPVVDRIIEGVSRAFDLATRRFFLPKTETRLYRWPPRQSGASTILWLDQDLLAVTTLKSEAQNSSPTTIAAADFFTEPNNSPPFDRIEIDSSSTAAFQAGDTPQRSISVLGRWGYSEDTRASGTVASGLSSDASATSMVCSDASLIDVGDSLLIESELLFVVDRAFAALGSILLNGALTATQSQTTVAVDGSHGVSARETILVDSEEMLVTSVVGNNLSVFRAFNGTTLAAHNNDTAVSINRTLTVQRGGNGTTAATHANATAVSKYIPPVDVVSYCVAEAVARYQQERAGWGRMVGAGEAQREFQGRSLGTERDAVIAQYKRLRMAAV